MIHIVIISSMDHAEFRYKHSSLEIRFPCKIKSCMIESPRKFFVSLIASDDN